MNSGWSINPNPDDYSAERQGTVYTSDSIPPPIVAWPSQANAYEPPKQWDDYTMARIAAVNGAQPSDPAGTSGPVTLDPYVGANSGSGRRQPSQPPVSGDVGSTDLY